MAEPDWYIRNELKLRHLHLLVVLDDMRSMGKVAAHTHVTQPAVSKALGEMEKGLGMKLFERTSRGILPTVFGECMVRHARTVLNELNQAADELRGLKTGALGRIHVGVLSNVIPALLPQSIALLKKRSPGTNVHLAEGIMDRLLPQLLAQKGQTLARADLRYTNGFALTWREPGANAGAAPAAAPASAPAAGRLALARFPFPDFLSPAFSA